MAPGVPGSLSLTSRDRGVFEPGGVAVVAVVDADELVLELAEPQPSIASAGIDAISNSCKPRAILRPIVSPSNQIRNYPV